MTKSNLPRLIGSVGTFELTNQIIRLGRAADNDIILNSQRSSRYHAEINFANGHYWLRDLQSTNGSAVNEQAVKNERQLTDGDLIRLGDDVFTFVAEARPDQSTVKDPPKPISAATSVSTPNELLQLDLEAHEVKLNGQVLVPPLSTLEWKLLVLLYQNQGKVCSRDSIIESVYDTSDPENIVFDGAIDALVSRLRKSLQINNPTQLPYLRTIRSVGYKLEL